MSKELEIYDISTNELNGLFNDVNGRDQVVKLNDGASMSSYTCGDPQG